MKIADGFVLKNIAGTNVVIPTGTNTVSFRAVITLNETGVFLWKLLEKGVEKEYLLEQMLKEYSVNEETAKADIESFIKKVDEAGLLR